jgi:hypothetical protein
MNINKLLNGLKEQHKELVNHIESENYKLAIETFKKLKETELCTGLCEIFAFLLENYAENLIRYSEFDTLFESFDTAFELYANNSEILCTIGNIFVR